MKKIISLVVVLTMLLTIFVVPQTATAAGPYNYAEALQKAIYFYECQQAGPLPAWNRVQWRGNATMNDYVKGGWYDAGDHVKFNLPMAYSASMLGWALYEYPAGFSAAGQTQNMKNNLQFVLDYLVACDKGSSFVYQIGDGGADHVWWGPVEILEKKMSRPYYTCTASCVTGQAAAALAIGSIVLNNASYLTHAKSLFNLADSTKSDSTYSAANGFYNSWSGFYDELVWAATWLYLATNDSTYLTKAEGYVANLNKQNQTTNIEYKWAISWDDVHYGALLLLARITGKQQYHDFMKMHLDWWTSGYNGEKITYTPGGLAWLDTWGSLRYANNTAFLANVYADMITDATLKTKYSNFAKSQLDYALGSNPNNRSYEIGFGTNPPVHPHHRTAHGSWSDQQSVPAYHRHTLYGALVGGPGSNDGYTDDISNYTNNEVACDYNAAFVGNLAKAVTVNGGTALTGFPPAETPEDEFFVEAGINSSGPTYTEIKAFLNNRSAWPARLLSDLSFNYYVDLTEVFAAGKTVADLTVSRNTAEIPAAVSPLTQYSGNIYYVKITFTDSTNIAPMGQSEYAREVQFRIAAPNGTTYWDPTNDYSYAGMTSTAVKTQNIPVYQGTTLIYGKEPNGQQVTPTPSSTPGPTSTPTPTATPTPTPTPSATPTPTPTVDPNSTATPTPTLTPTTTPTPTLAPTNTPGPGGIKIQAFNQNTSATSNTIYPNIKVVNTGTTAINLSDVKVRYYFTNDGTQANSFACDYSSVGSGNVSATFAATTGTNADKYCEIGFSTGAGTLAAGASAEVKSRIWKSDWSNFTQTNDYSFDATDTNYVDWTKVTGYLAGTLKWGTTP